MIQSVILCDVDISHSQKYRGGGFSNYVVFRKSAQSHYHPNMYDIIKVLFQFGSFEKRPSVITM